MTRNERICIFIDGYYSGWFNCSDHPSADGNDALADRGEQPLDDDERFEALTRVDRLIAG